MTTLTIELTNDKALRLLKDLEDLNIIRVVKSSKKLSSLRGRIKPLSDKDVDDQVEQLRNGWQRDI